MSIDGPTGIQLAPGGVEWILYRIELFIDGNTQPLPYSFSCVFSIPRDDFTFNFSVCFNSQVEVKLYHLIRTRPVSSDDWAGAPPPNHNIKNWCDGNLPLPLTTTPTYTKTITNVSHGVGTHEVVVQPYGNSSHDFDDPDRYGLSIVFEIEDKGPMTQADLLSDAINDFSNQSNASLAWKNIDKSKVIGGSAGGLTLSEKWYFNGLDNLLNFNLDNWNFYFPNITHNASKQDPNFDFTKLWSKRPLNNLSNFEHRHTSDIKPWDEAVATGDDYEIDILGDLASDGFPDLLHRLLTQGHSVACASTALGVKVALTDPLRLIYMIRGQFEHGGFVTKDKIWALGVGLDQFPRMLNVKPPKINMNYSDNTANPTVAITLKNQPTLNHIELLWCFHIATIVSNPSGSYTSVEDILLSEPLPSAIFSFFAKEVLVSDKISAIEVLDVGGTPVPEVKTDIPVTASGTSNSFTGSIYKSKLNFSNLAQKINNELLLNNNTMVLFTTNTKPFLSLFKTRDYNNNNTVWVEPYTSYVKGGDRRDNVTNLLKPPEQADHIMLLLGNIRDYNDSGAIRYWFRLYGNGEVYTLNLLESEFVNHFYQVFIFEMP